MAAVKCIRARFVAALLAIVCIGAGTAAAQPQPAKSCDQLRVELASTNPLTAVRRLANGQCLGGEFDTESATGRVNRLFANTDRIEGQARSKIKEVTLSVEEARALTLGVLRIAEEYLQQVAATASGADVADIGRMRGYLARAIRDHADGVTRKELPVLDMPFWTWDGEQAELGKTGIDVAAMLQRAGCGDTPRGPACQGAQAAVEGLLRTARLAERAFSVDQARAITAAAARAEARDARWRSYFADARSQYPWEILINSWRYEATVRRDMGLSGPPTSQWIVLHPDVALQYVGSASAGDRMKPAVILELVGYNFWSWGLDNRPENAWGASLVRTYADTATLPSGAWGVTVHRNSKYSLTVTRHSGKTGIALSVDLAGAAVQARDEVRNRFRLGE